MRVGSAIASSTRHAVGVGFQALLVAAIVAALAFATATVVGSAPGGAHSVFAAKGSNNGAWITVGSGTDATLATATVDSHFVASGCGFRAGSSDYYLVIYGPAPDTASLAYWVDPFPVGGDGCGSATPSWVSSGVDGTFDVYVVRSPSGNPWQAQPASNTVTITIINS
jgi:hypothetical protein